MNQLTWEPADFLYRIQPSLRTLSHTAQHSHTALRIPSDRELTHQQHAAVQKTGADGNGSRTHWSHNWAWEWEPQDTHMSPAALKVSAGPANTC